MEQVNDDLIQRIFNKDNFLEAFIKVKNHLKETIYDMDIEFRRFEESLDFYILILIERALKDDYQINPYIYYEKVKSNEEKRRIYELHFEDQIIIQAVLNVIGPILDEKISENSYGNRINISSKELIFKDWRVQYRRCYDNLKQTIIEYSDIEHFLLFQSDIKDYYNKINTLKLGEIIEDLGIKNRRILNLIQKFWFSLEKDKIILPQGPSFAHFFANLYLIPFDEFLNEKYVKFFRYVDDFWIIIKLQKEQSIDVEEIATEYITEINQFLYAYNLEIHKYKKDNKGKTNVHDLTLDLKKILKTINKKVSGDFIEFHEDFNDKDVKKFSEYLNEFVNQSDQLNIEEFMHKNSYKIIEFINKEFDKVKQETIIHNIIKAPKIYLQKGRILFLILLELREYNITYTTINFLTESSETIKLFFILSLNSDIIKRINIKNNPILKFLRNIIENERKTFLRSFALKKFLEITIINGFFQDYQNFQNFLIRISVNDNQIKKIISFYSNDYIELLTEMETMKYLERINKIDLTSLTKDQILDLENFLYVFTHQKYWTEYFSKDSFPFNLNSRLLQPNFLSTHPLFYSLFLIMFFRLSNDQSINILSDIYHENNVGFQFKNQIYLEALKYLSKFYNKPDYNFFKKEKKQFIVFVKDFPNEVQDILILNMKKTILNLQSSEDLELLETKTPYVYHFDDVYYYNYKKENPGFGERIAENEFSIQQINYIRKEYEKIFKNVLTIVVNDNIIEFKYNLPKKYQPLRNVIDFEDRQLAYKIFLKILCNLGDKLALLENPEDLCFLNFDNIYFNLENYDVILIYIAPNLFGKLTYFSKDKGVKCSYLQIENNKIYRILNNIIYEYFTSNNISSFIQQKDQKENFVLDLDKYSNPYLNYLILRISNIQNFKIFNDFKDFNIVLKNLEVKWETYYNNKDLRNLIEIFDFNIFLIERRSYIINKDKTSNFHSMSQLFDYYSKYLLNVSIINNNLIDIDLKSHTIKLPINLNRFYKKRLKIIENINLISEIFIERGIQVSTIQLKKYCYCFLYYSIYELIYRIFFKFGTKSNMIKILMKKDTDDIKKKIKSLVESNRLAVSDEMIDFQLFKTIIKGKDTSESEVHNFIQEIPSKTFIIMLLILYLEILQNNASKTILTRNINLRSAFSFESIRKIFEYFNAEKNLINISFLEQIHMITDQSKYTSLFEKNLALLIETFSPILKKIKIKMFKYAPEKKYNILSEEIAKRYLFIKKKISREKLPLICLFPNHFDKAKKLYQFKYNVKGINKILLYHYPCLHVCFNSRLKMDECPTWEGTIAILNKTFKVCKNGAEIKLDSLKNLTRVFNYEEIKSLIE